MQTVKLKYILIFSFWLLFPHDFTHGSNEESIQNDNNGSYLPLEDIRRRVRKMFRFNPHDFQEISMPKTFRNHRRPHGPGPIKHPRNRRPGHGRSYAMPNESITGSHNSSMPNPHAHPYRQSFGPGSNRPYSAPNEFVNWPRNSTSNDHSKQHQRPHKLNRQHRNQATYSELIPQHDKFGQKPHPNPLSESNRLLIEKHKECNGNWEKMVPFFTKQFAKQLESRYKWLMENQPQPPASTNIPEQLPEPLKNTIKNDSTENFQDK